MKPDLRLDSAVFQLTPTRTRCDLVIVANGKKEKIASGLLNPFLAHLKTAQDQIAKGGYSITLEPDPGIDAAWFTKDTVERFVRFVSTPEVLERVTTIELEIVQIEEAIAIQGNDNLGLSTVEDHQTKSTECIEASKSTYDADAEKAIVLYKPGSQAHPPDSNGSTTQEENSKVQLLRVLETRKAVLQKEQAMAFARATAAGFDMDHMAHLISFAESFGASRLKDACLRFMELWKRKHETGQWLEIEAVEAMSTRSEFSSLNASGIILAVDTKKQEVWPVPNSDMGSESNEKADKKIPSDPQVPSGPHEYFHGQFQHPPYPQWPMHSQPGPPVFQPYPMQGMPYYQNYPGVGPYFHPPYPPMEDPRFNTPQRMGLKRQSMDSKDSNVESDAWGARSQDGTDQTMSESEKDGSHVRESHRKVGRSRKKKSGVVVIRNINYITSRRHETSGSESQSASDSENEEIEDLHSDARERKHKNSSRTSTKKVGHTQSTEPSDVYDKTEAAYEQDADSGNWQAFQSFLLKAEEKTRTVDGDIFASEKQPPVKSKGNSSGVDPILPLERDSSDVQEQRMVEFDSLNGKASRRNQVASNDPLIISSEGTRMVDSHFKEIEGGGGGYRRTTSDEFMIYGRDKQMSRSSMDPLVDHEYRHAGNSDKSSTYNVTDESFIVPFRSGSQDHLGTDSRTAIDIDSEFPTALQGTEDSSIRANNQLSYEPDDLTLMLERGMENLSIGYDPAMDYEMQISTKHAVVQETADQEDASTKEEQKRSDKDQKLRVSQDGLDKRKKNALLRKGASSKLNPLAEAQKRAEKLRAYKVDLQKAKKEREEEERQRLEALKRERQKRIAARSGSNTSQSQITPQQTKARLPAKLSSGSYKGSKFTDSEPGSSSPVQKLPIRTTSSGSADSQKTTKTSRLNGSTPGLSKSVSSLPETKKENNGLISEAKAASIRAKRLSDPKGSDIKHTSSVKSVKRSIPDESQTKKISEIMQLDQSKSAALPELKVRTPKASETVQNKSTTKEKLQKGTASKTSQASESSQTISTNDKAPRLSNSEDNPVIDKSVVMLVNEVASAPVAQESLETIVNKDRSYRDDKREMTGLDLEYPAIRAPPSPAAIGEVKDSSESKLDDQLNSYEVVINYSKDESQKFSDSTVMEKPYQAPYARATSLEGPANDSTEFPEALPILDSETATTHTDSTKACVPNSRDLDSTDKTHETYEKPRSKEAKGFRKLLKFGRKSHSSASGEANLDSDTLSVDDHTVAAASSNDVPMLKNLISQDDTLAGGTPTKVSRPFSILSPFRSKNSEKKLTA